MSEDCAYAFVAEYARAFVGIDYVGSCATTYVIVAVLLALHIGVPTGKRRSSPTHPSSQATYRHTHPYL